MPWGAINALQTNRNVFQFARMCAINKTPNIKAKTSPDRISMPFKKRMLNAIIVGDSMDESVYLIVAGSVQF